MSYSHNVNYENKVVRLKSEYFEVEVLCTEVLSGHALLLFSFSLCSDQDLIFS